MATRKTTRSKHKIPAQKNGTGKSPGSRKTQFQPGNPWRIQPGEVRNPGGRPKLLSESYREWLEAENDAGVTNAAGVAMAMGARALDGDYLVAKEFRQATEGDRHTLDFSQLTDEQLARLARGESPQDVTAPGAGVGGAGAAPAAAGAPGPGPGDPGGPLAGPG